MPAAPRCLVRHAAFSAPQHQSSQAVPLTVMPSAGADACRRAWRLPSTLICDVVLGSCIVSCLRRSEDIGKSEVLRMCRSNASRLS